MKTTGEADSTAELYDEDGNLLQKRYYDDKGKAYKDIDYSHGNGSHTFPHEHTWTWKNGKPIRSK